MCHSQSYKYALVVQVKFSVPLLTWRKARDAAGNMVSIHMEINKSLRQLRHIDQEALGKYNIEENVL